MSYGIRIGASYKFNNAIGSMLMHSDIIVCISSVTLIAELDPNGQIVPAVFSRIYTFFLIAHISQPNGSTTINRSHCSAVDLSYTRKKVGLNRVASSAPLYVSSTPVGLFLYSNTNIIRKTAIYIAAYIMLSMCKRKQTSNDQPILEKRLKPNINSFEAYDFVEIENPISICSDYNALLMTDIRESEIEFFKELMPQIHEGPSSTRDYCLISVLQQSKYFVDGSFGLSVDALNKWFPNGHTLSFSLQDTYFVPLGIDMDHIFCEKKHSCSVNTMELYAMLETVFDVVMQYFKLQNRDFAKGCYIETKQCGIHLYFDMRVSIILYDLLIDYLNVTFADAGYVFDKVSCMPLPNSAKNVNVRYESFSDRVGRMCNIVSKRSKCYDVKLSTTINPSVNGIIIASTNHGYVVESDDDWLALDNKTKEVIYVTYENMPIESQTVPVCILKLAGKSISGSTNLCEYVKISDPLNDNFRINSHTSMPANIVDATHVLAQTILKSSNTTTDVCKADSFLCIYRLMCAPDYSCGYLTYIMCAFVNYIKKSCGISLCESVRVLGEYIGAVTCSNQQAMSNILWSYANMTSVNAFERCCVVFKDYIHIFRYITMMEYYGRKNADTFHTVLEKAIAKEFDESCDIDTLKIKLDHLILPYFFLTVKTSKSSDDCFMYDMCKFVYIKRATEDKLIERTANFVLLTQLLSKCCKKMGLKKSDFQEILVNSWLKYVPKIPIRSFKLGKYNFFVNTNIGVFNNIDGFYMSNTPFLYFQAKLQCKKYATLPFSFVDADNVQTIDLLNESLPSMYEAHGRLLKTLAVSTDQMFHIGVLLPGILSFGDIRQFSMHTCEKIMSMVISRTTCDSIDILVKHFDTVMKRFPLRSDDIVCVAYLFELISFDNRASSIETLLWEKCSTRGDPLQSIVKPARISVHCHLDYSLPGDALIDVVLQNYHLDISRLSFVRAYIYIILCKYDAFVFNSKLFVNSYLKIRTFETLSDDAWVVINNLEENQTTSTSFLVGTKADYSVESDINTRRAIHICFGDIPLDMATTLGSLYKMFGYNTTCILDFLTHSALLYQPWNETRKFVWLRGPPACGKSLIVTCMGNFHGDAQCPINSKLKSASAAEAPSSLVINAMTAYFTSVKEAAFVSENLIKIVTGQDAISLRDLFGGQTIVEPITFVVCISNSFPHMKADHAIKTRLVVFRMSSSFHDSTDLTNEELNPLILFLNEKNVKVPIDQSTFAVGLSNIFYATFRHYRNKDGLVVPQLNNLASHEEIHSFMVQNNIVYKLMHVAHIIEGVENEISYAELVQKVTTCIDAHNIGKTPRNVVNFPSFLAEFNEIFNANIIKINDDIVKYVGVGFPATKSYSRLLVRHSIGDNITEEQLIAALESLPIKTEKKIKEYEIFRRDMVSHFNDKTRQYENLCID